MKKEEEVKHNMNNRKKGIQQPLPPTEKPLAGSTIEERLAKMWNHNRHLQEPFVCEHTIDDKNVNRLADKNAPYIEASREHVSNTRKSYRIGEVNITTLQEEQPLTPNKATRVDTPAANSHIESNTDEYISEELQKEDIAQPLPMKDRSKKAYFKVFLVIFLILCGSGFAWYNNAPYHLRANKVYVELGTEVANEPSLYVRAKAEVLEAITIDISEVNAEVVGTYEVHILYEAETETIPLVIEDTSAPEVLLVATEFQVYEGKTLEIDDVIEQITEYSEYVASFDKEQVNTKVSFLEAKTETITLYVSDIYGNTSSKAINVSVCVDEEVPYFDGLSDVSVAYGTQFDPIANVYALDNADGDISQNMVVHGSVNTQKEGDYELTYEASDAAGNSTRQKRIVSVHEPKMGDKYEYTSSIHEKTVMMRTQVLAYLGDQVDTVGIAYYDIHTGNFFSINGPTQFRSASTAKVAAVMYAYEQIASGQASLSTLISYDENNHYEDGTGELQYVDKTTPIAVERLLRLAITHSDNIAFHMIEEYFGAENIMHYYESVIGHTSNHEMNQMSAVDGVSLLLHSYSSPIFTTLIQDLKATIFNDRISRDLPEDIVAHKIGSYGGNVHDIGIVYTKQPYILCVFSNGLSDAANIEAEISKLVYELHNEKDY